MSVPRRAVPVAVVVLAVALAAVVVVVALGSDGDRPPFDVGEVQVSTPATGEGLLGDRSAPPAAVDRTVSDDGTPVVQYRGGGSVAFRFAVVRLREDAAPQRIRQLDTAQVIADTRDPAVRWKGWVAPQRPADDLRRGEPATAVVGPWRAADGDGVLVRPGEMVRLRTRFDASARTDGPCSTVTFEDGPTWETREDGSDGAWERLRYRDADPVEDTTARTGMDGRISFRAGADCDRGSDLDSTFDTVAIDGPVD